MFNFRNVWAYFCINYDVLGEDVMLPTPQEITKILKHFHLDSTDGQKLMKVLRAYADNRLIDPSKEHVKNGFEISKEVTNG